jgi:hypothetical protein
MDFSWLFLLVLCLLKGGSLLFLMLSLWGGRDVERADAACEEEFGLS